MGFPNGLTEYDYGRIYGPHKGNYYRYNTNRFWEFVGDFCLNDINIEENEYYTMHDINNDYLELFDDDQDGIEDNSLIPLDDYSIADRRHFTLVPSLTEGNLFMLDVGELHSLTIENPENEEDCAKFRVIVRGSVAEFKWPGASYASMLIQSDCLQNTGYYVIDFTKDGDHRSNGWRMHIETGAPGNPVTDYTTPY